MVLLGQFVVRIFNLLLGGILVEPEYFIGIFGCIRQQKSDLPKSPNNHY